MRCWSCGKEIADGAQRCSHCEAMVDASPNFEEMEMAREFIDNLDPEMRKRLYEVFEDSSTGEEFVDRIMVGNCPQCDSPKTGNCEHDPDIEDVSIGRCFDCGYLWCTICDSPYTPGVECPVCQELEDELEDELDDSMDEPVALNRYHLLAAEMFGYSFANYQNHLGIGHERYEELMPHAVQQVERAVQEGWSLAKLAKKLFPDEESSEEEAQRYIDAYKKACQVVDAESPAEAFRNAVRGCIRYAVREGLEDDDAIEKLVSQICYRASDLAVLLEMEGEFLSQYSDELRHPTAKDQHGPIDNRNVDEDDDEEEEEEEEEDEDDDGYPGSYYDPDDDD